MIVGKAAFVRGMILCTSLGVICNSTAAASVANPRSWNNYTWGREANLTIQLVNNTSAQWTPFLQTAANQWSSATNIDYEVVPGPAIDSSVCSPAYGVVEVCSADYGKTGWLGLTNVYTSGGHIVMATVKYNDYYPSTSAFYSAAEWYTNTSCHELGHVLGLTHQDPTKNNANSGSCMDLTNSPTGKKSGYGPISDLEPGLMDFAALEDIYAIPSGIQLGSTIEDGGSFGSSVPEPTAWALMMFGLGLVGITTRRRPRSTTMVADVLL